MAEEKKVYTRTKGIIEGAVSGFCPGCMHSTIHKIIGEAAEELGQLDNLVRVEGVGCCGLGQFYVTCDETIAAHGRAGAVATGIKRSSPNSLVYTYQGDGDLAAIGLAETLSAANRGENFTVIFVNNGIYGMTGGQMAPTTLAGMKAVTCPRGRDVNTMGYPLHITELIAQLPNVRFVTRQSVHTPANVRKAKAAIRKAFENQKDGKGGLSFVEIVSNCNSNWKMTAVDANKWMEENTFKEYPLGDIKVEWELQEGKISLRNRKLDY